MNNKIYTQAHIYLLYTDIYAYEIYMCIFKIYTDTFYKNTQTHINFFAHIIWTITLIIHVGVFFKPSLTFLHFFFCKDSCAAKQLEVKALKGLDYKKVKTKIMAILPTEDRTKKQLAGFILHNGAVFLDEVNNLPRINIKIRPWSPHSVGVCMAGGIPTQLTPLETYVVCWFVFQFFLSENILGLFKQSTLCVRYLGESVQPWQELVDRAHCSVLKRDFLQHCHVLCPRDDIWLWRPPGEHNTLVQV